MFLIGAIALCLLISKFVRGSERKARWMAFCLAVAIVVTAGPEVFAAVELTTLLDLLGVALFLIAFSVGARLLFVRAGSFIRGLLLPHGYDWLLYVPTLAARAVAIMGIGRNALIMFVFVVASCKYLDALM
jgi:hypothetical protein